MVFAQKPDPRRDLYREFLRYVDYFQPQVFVIENVLGIRSAGNGEYFTRVQKEARELGQAVGRPGYRVHSQVEDAWELGVPQKRRRQLIVGVRNDLPGYFLPELRPAPRARRHTCLGAVIGDLPILRAGGGKDERDYDLACRTRHLLRWGDAGRNYLLKVLEIERVAKLTNYVARPHNNRDLPDFARLKEGENSKEAMRDRNVVFEFPYNKDHFKDRYTRQNRRKACSTIVAHLSKDGLMFVHPTQNRSLTSREAARVQSFPDWFRFPAPRTHAFRLIGNAVPPLVAEAIGLATKDFLREARACGVAPGEPCREYSGTHKIIRRDACRNTGPAYIPRSPTEAVYLLERLVRPNSRALRTLPVEEFLQGWDAMLYLFPGIHPDSALDHGQAIATVAPNEDARLGAKELLSPRYVRSGWPTALELSANISLN